MRNTLRRPSLRDGRVWYPPSAHIGLAYDLWAPTGADDGKVPDTMRDDWFDALEQVAVTADYEKAFQRWKGTLAHLGTTILTVRLEGRMLVGHGNPSGSEVGLTVHHTWGTPIVPGSSLKGLLHHWIVRRYGPEPPPPDTLALHPLAADHPDPVRSPFQGVTWRDKHIHHGPGTAIRQLCGAPDAETDDDWLRAAPDAEVGARRGGLTFHDAWMVPAPTARNPYVRDVLTVHQRRYYNQGAGERAWPNDYDSPNPVTFLTVRPGLEFLVALSGDSELADFAIVELQSALAEEGVGGKTVAGYGRLRVPDRESVRRLTPPVSSSLLDDLQDYVDMKATAAGLSDESGQRDWWNALKAQLLGPLLQATPEERLAAVGILRQSRFNNHRKLKAEVADVIASLEG